MNEKRKIEAFGRRRGEIGRKSATRKKFSIEYGKLFGHTG